MTVDAVLNTTNGYYDIEWGVDGDIQTAETLDTYILLCLFEDQRAGAAEIPTPTQRRGWEGDESTPDFELGSKLWLFEQDRLTGSMLAELGQVARNALQPLIDEVEAVSVDVGAPFVQGGIVQVPVDIRRDGSQVDKRYYALWDGTGVS